MESFSRQYEADSNQSKTKKLLQIDSSNVHSNIHKNKRSSRKKCRLKREKT